MYLQVSNECKHSWCIPKLVLAIYRTGLRSLLFDEYGTDGIGELPSVPQHKCTRSVKKQKKKEEMTTLFMPVLSV